MPPQIYIRRPRAAPRHAAGTEAPTRRPCRRAAPRAIRSAALLRHWTRRQRPRSPRDRRKHRMRPPQAAVRPPSSRPLHSGISCHKKPCGRPPSQAGRGNWPRRPSKELRPRCRRKAPTHLLHIPLPPGPRTPRGAIKSGSRLPRRIRRIARRPPARLSFSYDKISFSSHSPAPSAGAASFSRISPQSREASIIILGMWNGPLKMFPFAGCATVPSLCR